MRILFIDDQPEDSKDLLRHLEERRGSKVTQVASLQTAIEMLEAKQPTFDLVVCDYHGGSMALLGCLLLVSADAACIVISDLPKAVRALPHFSRDSVTEVVSRSAAAADLKKVLSRLERDGLFHLGKMTDDEFVRVDTRKLVLTKPLRADIYVRLSMNRYCKRFQAGDDFDSDDLERHFKRKSIESLYILKSQASAILDNYSRDLDKLTQRPDTSAEQARDAAENTLGIIHDVVEKMGFTPELQELAKKSVALTLKALGASPKLSNILSRLRRHEGKYIAAHSVMLAEVTCAVASMAGWESPTNFLKLSMAAFLHDLSMNDNELAALQSLEDLENAHLTTAQTRSFKSHPLKAAEYARQLGELPVEIQSIVAQHHERPDGSGFPEGLEYPQIDTLSCIFIVAHDLLHFFLTRVPSNDRATMIEAFLKENQRKYSEGQFKEICDAIRPGT